MAQQNFGVCKPGQWKDERPIEQIPEDIWQDQEHVKSLSGGGEKMRALSAFATTQPSGGFKLQRPLGQNWIREAIQNQKRSFF